MECKVCRLIPDKTDRAAGPNGVVKTAALMGFVESAGAHPVAHNWKELDQREIALSKMQQMATNIDLWLQPLILTLSSPFDPLLNTEQNVSALPLAAGFSPRPPQFFVTFLLPLCSRGCSSILPQRDT